MYTKYVNPKVKVPKMAAIMPKTTFPISPGPHFGCCWRLKEVALGHVVKDVHRAVPLTVFDTDGSEAATTVRMG